MTVPPIISVSDLNSYVSQSLRADALLRDLRLRGEVSGLKEYPRAWYFELKDERARVSCVMFSQAISRTTYRPRNGDQVILHGSAGLYPEHGTFQFIADAIRPEGTGSLWQQFERLKEKLEAEGLFDASRKRPLPARPHKIAVVTSASGAVWHDIHKICRERDPGVPLVLVPVPVQGEEAGAQIAQGIRLAGKLPGVDLMIIGRGGGSMQELWCFNDERVARAIAASPLPVISAVGHETDFTIADFVADCRASTPSNAAEMAVPDQKELRRAFESLRRRLYHLTEQAVMTKQLRLSEMRERIKACSPQQQLERHALVLAHQRERLRRAMSDRIQELSQRLEMDRLNLDRAADAAMQRLEQQLERQRIRAENQNPARVMERGFAMVTRNGIPVVSALDAQGHMTVHFRDGSVPVRREEENHGGEGKTAGADL